MLFYVWFKHERLYCGLVSIETQDMSYQRRIVATFNSKTVGQNYKKGRKDNDDKQLKRSTSQTDERPSRPDNPSIPKRAAYARLPDNHKDPQNLRSVLWT